MKHMNPVLKIRFMLEQNLRLLKTEATGIISSCRIHEDAGCLKQILSWYDDSIMNLPGTSIQRHDLESAKYFYTDEVKYDQNEEAYA